MTDDERTEHNSRVEMLVATRVKRENMEVVSERTSAAAFRESRTNGHVR